MFLNKYTYRMPFFIGEKFKKMDFDKFDVLQM